MSRGDILTTFKAPELAGAGRRSRGSSDQHRVVEPMAGEPQTGSDILQLEVRQLLNNFLRSQAIRQEIENVADADPQATDARSTTALLGIHRDALRKLGHSEPPPGRF